MAETTGTKLRRLLSAADSGNAATRPILLGSLAWTAAAAWAASTAYSIGNIVSNGGNFYLCLGSGTSASSGGPGGAIIGNRITDNSVYWVFIASTTLYPAGTIVSNGGNCYIARIGGNPATSGTGPTGRGTGITDGSVTWDYCGPQTAPVLTRSLTHNSALTNQYQATNSLADNTGIFRFRGGVPTSKFGRFVGTPVVNIAPAGGNFAGTQNALYSSAETTLEGTKIEWDLNTVTTPVHHIVDGAYIDQVVMLCNNGGDEFHTLDFTNVISQSGALTGAGRSRHKVRVEWSPGTILCQAAVAPIDKLSYPSAQDNFATCIIGDSWSQGTGTCWPPATANNDFVQAYAAQFMHRAGLPDINQVAIGGTGYTNPGASSTYISHIMTDLAAINAWRPIGMIIFQGSTNDENSTASAAQAAAFACFQAVRGVYPTVPIIVLGCNDLETLTPTASASVESWVSAAVAQQKATGDNNIYWVPMVGDPNGAWFTGSGSDQAPNGTGNNDVDCNGLIAHPSNNGHAMIAMRLANAYRTVVASMA
jgi:hypothetical protein